MDEERLSYLAGGKSNSNNKAIIQNGNVYSVYLSQKNINKCVLHKNAKSIWYDMIYLSTAIG